MLIESDSGKPAAWVSVRGRVDSPVDGVQDYLKGLGPALDALGVRLEAHEVPWAGAGWLRGLAGLWNRARGWRSAWCLVQYTTGMWSRKGLPGGLLAVLLILRLAGARRVLVFHDPAPWSGSRWRDRVRRILQVVTIRTALHLADRVICVAVPEATEWLPPGAPRRPTAGVPAGSVVRLQPGPRAAFEDPVKTVTVFGFSGSDVRREAEAVAEAVRLASPRVGPVRLVLVGRGAEEAGAPARAVLGGASSVQLDVVGLADLETLQRILQSSHAQLAVRGVTTQRSTVIAGINCGVPIVGYRTHETAPPITEAGLRLVSGGDVRALGSALADVLSDSGLWHGLTARSREAAGRHFSWPAIAGRMKTFLETGAPA